jgi:lipoprotein-anchoring transpeptidase ErfK/SrfK
VRAAVTAALTSVLTTGLMLGAMAADGQAASRSHPARPVAVLFASHVARSEPTRRSRLVQRVSMLRPLTGERTRLPVIARHLDRQGTTWLRVLLPGRPNGHTGWIVERSTADVPTPWLIVVHLGRRRVTVFRHGVAIRTFRAVVGAPSTPTPRGSFFVEEAIELPAGDVGAPYALALSARSRVFQEFDGGPGQIALHGLMNVGGILGTAASHGCVRLANTAMRWLVERIGPGVPVSIRE